jgi:predicted GIY-YIG superfamily endonuclease
MRTVGLVLMTIGMLAADCGSAIGCIFLIPQSQIDSGITPSELPDRDRTQKGMLDRAVIEAFAEAHDGFSSDEVLIKDELRSAFLAKAQKEFPDASEFECNWTLLNLRKANKLTVKATKRTRTDDDLYFHAAEIAARTLHDSLGVSSDRVMADPILRNEFDRLAKEVAGDGVTTYQLRKAALSLRKARQLKPELIVRIADWGRRVQKYTVQSAREQLDSIPTDPGVYIFSDATGYLYIGESSNLRERLTEHLDESDRKSLAAYLQAHDAEDIHIEIHAFDPDSQAKSKPVRRAYESELIRSRQPRLNIAP